MSSLKRTCTALTGLRPARLTTVVFAFAVTGCSADVTRFEYPTLGLTETNDRPVASAPAPQGPPPYASHTSPPPRAGLAGEPLPPPERTATLPPPSYERDAARAPIASRPAAPRAVASGETIVVQNGDTLYGIAKRHHVPVSSLIEVNNLGANANIKPGQKLALPAGASPATETARPAAPRFTVVKTAAAPQQPTPAAAPSNWDGLHTMKSGESLYSIARQYRVTSEELQRNNHITEPTKVRIGAKLRVPSRGAAEPEAPREPVASAQPIDNDPVASQPAPGTGTVRMINAPQRKAAVEPARSDAEPVAAASGARFQWPARGRMLAGFGKRPDGTHNDGINLSVPMGSDILAAEGGRVAYAGSDIQAYGNLILIRHDNGWVTAYAHADKILVQRDEVVRRGQVIAKAGRTGTVDQPQVHFELRQGAKPVDPMPHLER